MGRRGRFRKTGRRTPSGRLSQAGQQPDHNPFLLAQRLRVVDPGLAEAFLALACRPEAARSQEEQAIVVLGTQRAHNPNLAYPPGIAYERGLFRNTDAAGETHDGRELLQAADIYVGLHRSVWGKLSDDIEADITRRWGPRAFELLLEVGRVNAPAPPASHFRQLVAGTPAPLTDPDPDQYLRRRLRLADRYAAARTVLLQLSLLSLHVVEAIAIEGRTLGFLKAGTPRTASSVRDEQAFVAGLKALADHFGLIERAKQRIRTTRERDELAPAAAG
jgi:hypothetical protein